MNNRRIFITGGTGFLGKNIIKRYYDNNEIIVYSRDESKQYYLNKIFPRVRCIVGDIRNYDLLKRSSVGADVAIYAASMKQIGSVDQNYEEASKIIIDGAINSRRASEENNHKSAVFISSDKSRAATTIYGAMKFVAGESFIVNSDNSNTKLTTAIYGNVMNSTGSIIPLMWDSINKKYELTLYSEEMTRFMVTIEQAIDLIEYSLNYTGVNVIPKAKSFRIRDLFEIYSEKFGLKYSIGKPRISEKIHEIMLSKEEIPRTFLVGDYYQLHYKNINNNILNFTNEYSSMDTIIDKTELIDFLEKENYYR